MVKGEKKRQNIGKGDLEEAPGPRARGNLNKSQQGKGKERREGVDEGN